MKKFVKTFSLALTLCFLLSFAAGCSLFADENEAAEGGSRVTLTLNDEDGETEKVVTYGEKATVEIPTKKGYYFVGYFDSQEGGTKYFDGNGKALLQWKKDFPIVLYAQWGDIRTLKSEITVFDNEPKDGGSSGQRTAKIRLDEEFIAALQGNFDAKLNIEYTVDLKTGEGWEVASPIGLYIKGYDNSGAERYTVFTHTPKIGEFSTFTGSVEIEARDFTDGNIYFVLWNTKKQLGAWGYPVYYSRNLILNISFA